MGATIPVHGRKVFMNRKSSKSFLKETSAIFYLVVSVSRCLPQSREVRKEGEVSAEEKLKNLSHSSGKTCCCSQKLSPERLKSLHCNLLSVPSSRVLPIIVPRQELCIYTKNLWFRSERFPSASVIAVQVKTSGSRILPIFSAPQLSVGGKAGSFSRGTCCKPLKAQTRHFKTLIALRKRHSHLQLSAY